MVLPPRSRNSAGEGRRTRVTIRVKNEIDGMIYTLVFEGSLEKLFVRQLKRHIQDTAGVLVCNQQLIMGREELADDRLCSEYGMRDGQILTLMQSGETVVPRAGIQPQQLPPPGAVFPPPPPVTAFDEQPAREQLHSEYNLPVPEERVHQPAPYQHEHRYQHQHQHQPPPVDNYYIPPPPPPQSINPPVNIRPDYEQPLPPTRVAHRPNVPSYNIEDRPSSSPSDHLIEKLRENNERLRTLQQNEAELHNRELELSSQERIFRKNYEEAQNSRLTEEHLRHHQDAHKQSYGVNDDDDDGSIIIGIEEIPPSPTHVSRFGRQRSEEKRISPLRHRRSVPLSTGSFQYPTRSKSMTEQTVQSVRSFEMESNWKSSCTKFDLQRSHNASQMDKMQQQLLERQAELEKLSRGMEQDILHTNEKRRIVEELKLKCALG